MYEHGTIIWSNSISYQGVISFGNGWWLAFQSDDPDMHLRMIKEDVVD